MNNKNKKLYVFEAWMKEMKHVIEWHKFKLEMYNNEAEFSGTSNGYLLIAPEPPIPFIEYLLKHGEVKQKKNGTIKVKIAMGELEQIYKDFKQWYKRISKVDEILLELE